MKDKISQNSVPIALSFGQIASSAAKQSFIRNLIENFLSSPGHFSFSGRLVGLSALVFGSKQVVSAGFQGLRCRPASPVTTTVLPLRAAASIPAAVKYLKFLDIGNKKSVF